MVMKIGRDEGSVFVFLFCLFYTCEGDKCNENLYTKYFEEGSPLITEQVEQSFGNTFFLYPRYTPVETEFNDTEQNVYVKSENISETTFCLYKSQFPDFPNYKINIVNSSIIITKCDKDNSCKLLEECSEACIESQGNQTSLSDDIIYLSWKKTLSTIFLLVQYQEKIKRCTDFNEPINIRRVVLQSNKRLQFAYTQHSVVTTTRDGQEMPPVNLSLRIGESVYVRISQCSICSMTLQLKCGIDDIGNKIARSDKGPRLLFSNNFFIYGWNEIELSPKYRIQKNTCLLEMFGSYDTTRMVPFEVIKFWRATYRLAKGTPPPPPPTTTTDIFFLPTQMEKVSTITVTTDDTLSSSDTTTSKNRCISEKWMSHLLAGCFFVTILLL